MKSEHEILDTSHYCGSCDSLLLVMPRCDVQCHWLTKTGLHCHSVPQMNELHVIGRLPLDELANVVIV